MKNFTWVVLAAVLLASHMIRAETDTPAFGLAPREGWDFTEFAEIPVQANGRIKPLLTYAREASLFVTGSKKFKGWPAEEMLLSWMVSSDQWQKLELIQVVNAEAKRELGLEEKKSRFSYDSLVGESYLTQYLNGIAQQAPPDKKDIHQDPRNREKHDVVDRLRLFRGIVSGEAWSIVPSEKESSPWASLAQIDQAHGNQVRELFRGVALAYQGGDRTRFEQLSLELRQAIIALVASQGRDSLKLQNILRLEVLYDRAQFFMWAWILYLIAGLILLTRARFVWGASFVGLAALAHIAGFTLRCLIAGRPPVSNMYESVVWVGLGVVVFAAVITKFQFSKLPLTVASVLATLTLLAAEGAPAVMDGSINPLVPVLRSNYWLTIHVLTITLSYAAFALCFGLAHVTLIYFWRQSNGANLNLQINGLNSLTYRAMQFGVVLVAAGTILGGIWADYSWGRFWGWDPKEVWALIVLLTYLVILHGRYAGWVRQFGFAVWSLVSFLSVIMAWYGVNFILGVGLHSYGFSIGGRTSVAIFTAMEMAFVLVVVTKVRRRA